MLAVKLRKWGDQLTLPFSISGVRVELSGTEEHSSLSITTFKKLLLPRVGLTFFFGVPFMGRGREVPVSERRMTFVES